MTLTPQFLDELRARTLLSALIGRTVKIQKAGREFRACCPFHNEKTPSFYINDDKGFYHCFGCSAHGDAIRWMTDNRGLSFMDAVKELAQTAGMQVPAPDPKSAERAERANSLYDVMTEAATWFAVQLSSSEGAEARAYLKQRGITEATIKRFGLGFAPDSKSKLKAALSHFGDGKLVEAGLLISVDDKAPYDRFRGRLMIPIRDPRGRVIAFGGRILGAGEPKYLNSPDTPLFDKGRTLYNLDQAGAAARKSGRIIAVEGYLDVIAMAQVGIDDVVAPLGTALTEEQIERLWRHSNVPILCFDGDSAGQKAADRAAKRALPHVRPGFSLDFVTLPDGKDPADLALGGAAAALSTLLNTKRQDMSARLWQSEVRAEPLATPTARAGLRSRLQNLAETIENPLVKQEYKSTFNSLFWENFGWRRRDVDGAKAAIYAASGKPLRNLTDLVVRAVLLGLSRHPDVLRTESEQIDAMHIANADLRRWRDILTNAIYERPDLDESLIDTILEASDLTKIEARDLTRDLGFSFFAKTNGDLRGASELREVIATLNAEHEVEIQLAQTTERLKAQSETADFNLQQELLNRRAALHEKLRAMTEASDDLAPLVETMTG